MWMVRAGPDARNIDDFRGKGLVAVGWWQVRPVTGFSSREEIEREIAGLQPDLTRKQRIRASSQLDRFRAALSVGDRVITYDSDRRDYLVGTITSEPEFDPGLVESLPNFRKVASDGTVARDRHSVSSRNSLGAIHTLFRLADECAAEYEADRAGVPLTLMDLDDLVAAVVEYYEQMDGDTKALVRLRRVYWPA